MNQRIRFTRIPAGNPLANALLLIVGAAAVAAALVLGFFAFIVLSGIVLVLAGVVGIRLWWLGRRLRAGADASGPGQAQRAAPGRVIEGEYTVVSARREKKSPD